MEARGARAGQRLSREEQRAFENELILMDFVKGPGVLQVYGFAHDVHCTLLVLEFAPFGSLWEMLCDSATYPTLPLSLLISWVFDISHALISLFEKGVRHGDIKAQNTLLFSDLKLKLCDFGTTKKTRSTLGAQGTDSPRGAAGTLAFMAPEIRNGEKAHPSGSDIYSLAVTAIQIFSRSEPRIDDVEGQIERCFEIYSVDIDSAALVRLLKQAASKNPSDRPTARQLHKQLSDLLQTVAKNDDVVEEIEATAKRFWKAKLQQNTNSLPLPSPPRPPTMLPEVKSGKEGGGGKGVGMGMGVSIRLDGLHLGRSLGEAATYDVFLSYRVDCDLAFVGIFYQKLRTLFLIYIYICLKTHFLTTLKIILFTSFIPQ